MLQKCIGILYLGFTWYLGMNMHGKHKAWIEPTVLWS